MMSMNSHVYGIKPADEKWEWMKKVYDSCVSAGIDPPVEVTKFFNYESPDDKGVIVEIEKTNAVEKYNEEMREGFEVDLKKLPKDITIIRFVNSY